MKKVLFTALIIVLCVAMTCCGRGVYTGAEPLVMMDGIESIPSKKGTGMVYNFHIVDDYTDERDINLGYPFNVIASVTAPDGNTYLVYENPLPNSTEMTDAKFELYIMSKSGWNKVAEANCGFINGGYGNVLTDINILSDSESNIYILAYSSLSLNIYKYTPYDGKMIVADSMYIAGNPSFICAESDESNIYIAILFSDFIDVARYNFEEEKVYQNDSVIPKNEYALSNDTFKMVLGKNGSINIIVCAFDKRNEHHPFFLEYLYITNIGETNQEIIYRKIFDEYKYEYGLIYDHIISIYEKNGGGGGGIAIDKNGKVHVIYSVLNISKNTINYMHAIISDGNCDSLSVIEPCYITSRQGVEYVWEYDGDIYFIEVYQDDSKYLTICKIDNVDHSKITSSVEFKLPKGIYARQIKVFKSVLLNSYDLIYEFETKYEKLNFCYCHVKMEL